MPDILTGSTEPVRDLLIEGACFVPGFFDGDEDAMAAASDLLSANPDIGADGRGDIDFGLLTKRPLDDPIRYLGEKVITLLNTSSEVVREEIPPFPRQGAGSMGRRFRPDDHIGWHRDDNFLGNWVSSIAVIRGSGHTVVGGSRPLIGRLRPTRIESKAGDLICIRGKFPARTTIPYPTGRPLHKARAGDTGRDIIGLH